MTSQIAIFNPLGVALASDTVTTITTEGGTKSSYNAEKMWPLAGGHLVAVMVSGSVNLNGIHSRILVSEWNRTLEKPFGTLAEYATSFVEWFSQEKSLVPEESELKELHFYLNNHFHFIRERTIEVADELDSDEEIAETFIRFVKEGKEYLESLPLFEGSTDDSDAELLVSMGIDLDQKIDYIFNNFPALEDVRDDLKTSASLVLSRLQEMPSDTDLAFIGFGADEYFATSIKVKCRGRYGNTARISMSEPFGTSASDSSGSLVTFAQNSAIFGFLRGAQWDVLNELFGYVWNKTIERHDDERAGEAEARLMVDEMRDMIEKYMFSSFTSPMLDAIGSLSLRDVAELAEALVGIQAIRAVASPKPATVGGFIESLVIDRADGIRWVKRLPR